MISLAVTFYLIYSVFLNFRTKAEENTSCFFFACAGVIGETTSCPDDFDTMDGCLMSPKGQNVVT